MKLITSVWVIKRFWFPHRTLRLEVRVGPSPLPANHGLRQIVTNKVCGTTSSNAKTESDYANCALPINGRYLTLQSLATVQMNIGEINIYKAGNSN